MSVPEMPHWLWLIERLSVDGVRVAQPDRYYETEDPAKDECRRVHAEDQHRYRVKRYARMQ